WMIAPTRRRVIAGRVKTFRTIPARWPRGAEPASAGLCFYALADGFPLQPQWNALPAVIPAARTLDSSVDCRAAGISLISRAAATPTLRAYQSALRAAGISPWARRRIRAGN